MKAAAVGSPQGYHKRVTPADPAALAWLARNGSRKDRRAALRDLRRIATAPAKK